MNALLTMEDVLITVIIHWGVFIVLVIMAID